ncbi:hypothetical protein [Bradyrhizobium betae]|uniref:Uncharacterized protein n=1 Tax=Bradyrhizobium betae TaxID=244734 RepID=A0A5P6NYZ7_9BRAD|nr:hypothetical protein [Bradyrhizobium betae]QFI71347.1 hypothetical protein F8237_02555 [Bradyrhizobium betae]
MDDQPATRPARSADRRRWPELLSHAAPDSARRPELSTAELAFRIYAAFRAHPHVCNVLTHISRARWIDVEQSINSILDPATSRDDLSPLGQNIVELMVAERGISGKILKPYFQVVLQRLLGPLQSERLMRRIDAMYLDLERKIQHPVQSPAPSISPKESDHARSKLQ